MSIYAVADLFRGNFISFKNTKILSLLFLAQFVLIFIFSLTLLLVFGAVFVCTYSKLCCLLTKFYCYRAVDKT